MELVDVTVAYDATPVVRDVSLDIPERSWIGLIGPNGAGKTTILRAIAGLVPHTGCILIDGEPIETIGRQRLSQLVAFVPQRPEVPEAMRVVDYVLMGRTPYIPYLGTETRHDLEIAEDVLDRLDLVGFADRALSSLSGGEVQRAVLARALAQQAPILLLDEPTSALDVGHQQQVLELIDRLRHDHELTVVAAMHDLTLAGQFAGELALLSEGGLVACGTPVEVLTEEMIRTYYEANVRVMWGEDGTVLVVPTRRT